MTRRHNDGAIVGVDGCRSGWVVASSSGWTIVSELAHALPHASVVGVDIPIGLADQSPRVCDAEARRFLSPRGSTVFPAPCRSVLAATTYAQANELSRAASGRGVSRQTFALVPKIREADELARAGAPLVEIHPECAFARMAGSVLESKHSAAGLAARAELIRHHVGPVDIGNLPRGCSVDDVLDAHAVLWSARRFEAGRHVTFGDGSRDSLGLTMRIVS